MRKLLEFRRSPNCVKVRIGLALKKLDFETEEITAADRGPLLDAAGWPLVPVLVDGDVVMRESEAILHYLDANYRDAPSLALDDPKAMKDAERVDRVMQSEMTTLVPLVGTLMGVEPGERDPEKIREIHAACDRVVEPLEARLAGQPYLSGDRPTLYDITCACRVMTMRPPASFVAESDIWKAFSQILRLSPGFDRVAEWQDGLTALDGLSASAE